MTRRVQCTLAQLPKLIEKDMQRLQKRVDKAILKTAHEGVAPIRARVPVAFGELRESVQDYPRGLNGNPVISVDAPHAAAVEIGSRPHTPDFAKLLAWVKLRGMQGLSSSGRVKSKKWKAAGRGPTTAQQARRVARMFKDLEVRGRRGGDGRHSPVDAAEAIARAISKGIQEHGTKPHFFVRNALPEIEALLGVNLRAAVEG